MTPSGKRAGSVAADIMVRPVRTVSISASVTEVAHLFTDSRISAAAVLNADGVPVGVITKTDLVRHEHDGENALVDRHPYTPPPAMRGFPCHSERGCCRALDDARDLQRSLSTPPASAVARRMIRYGIHHMFVRARDGKALAGIVSAFDVLQLIGSTESK